MSYSITISGVTWTREIVEGALKELDKKFRTKEEEDEVVALAEIWAAIEIIEAHIKRCTS